MELDIRKAAIVGIAVCGAGLLLSALSHATEVAAPAADQQAMTSECIRHRIIGANGSATQIAFYDRDGAVVQTLKDHVKRGDLAIQVLGCDANYFFVTTAAGQKAKVKRIDVQIDGVCKAADVTDAMRNVAATNGLGVC